MKTFSFVFCSVLERRRLFVSRVLWLLVVALLCVANLSLAAEIKVLKTGLGDGSVTSSPAGIDCGNTCDFSFAGNVTLTANFDPAKVSFAGWQGTGISCPGTGACVVDASTAHRVRAVFNPIAAIPPLSECNPGAAPPNDCSHDNIRNFLTTNPEINTASEFIAALHSSYKENWILMNRSESLQTGVATSPRILMPSHDARFVFSFGLKEHDSFPGSHHNAIEYMQYDDVRKNFRFHEIILDTIPAMHCVGGTEPGCTGGTYTFEARSRGVTEDDPKCTKCHSTHNVPNTSNAYGTAPRSITRGDSIAKNKPNWDAYDSWGGMTPFNRDRIYQGSVEEAAFKSMFNLWNWRASAENDEIRKIIEQLALQPANLNLTSKHQITRDLDDASNSGHIEFGYELAGASAAPAAGIAPNTTNYQFNNTASGSVTTVNQEARYVTMRHSGPPGSIPGLINESYTDAGLDEGRGVQLFDLLGGLDGQLNPKRIADELINHKFATSDIPIDVRPIALAIARGYVTVNSASNSIQPAITTDFDFFNERNGMTYPAYDSINELVADTRLRAESLPRRKADIQKLTLDRTSVDGTDTDATEDPDPYLVTADIGQADSLGLIQQYAPGLASGIDSRRQEIFRRSIDLGGRDNTTIGRVAVDREHHDILTTTPPIPRNTTKVALFRYFLEPLGVSVDKWSMGVRGRSRAYNFADVFGNYTGPIASALEADLVANPPRGFATFTATQANVMTAVNNTLDPNLLPDVSNTAANVPTFTDVQRIFNKSCIECHGGLNYPPYYNHDTFLDISERETPHVPPLIDPLWDRFEDSYNMAVSYASPFLDSNANGDFDDNDDGVFDDGGGFFYSKIARRTNEDCPHNAPGVTRGMMPCGGPALTKADIETFKRWIQGSTPKTAGDPHLRTIEGVDYDFQAAGEFVLLSGPGLEIQARHTPIEGTAPYGPNTYTGLTSCVSVNTAVALRIGNDRVSYQSTPRGLQLRIDGKLWDIGSSPIPLPSGGRILRTSVADGIQIEAPGGTKVVVTPYPWSAQQLWFMNIDLQHVRGTKGLLGAITPGNWLPALPDGSLLGAKPKSLEERYRQLYKLFGDAWRVSDSRSLFDYAPGTSTANFSFPSWPNGESPQSCYLPVEIEGPARPQPVAITPIAITQAETLCAAVRDPIQKNNCIGDVSITGEAGFAQVYLGSQKIESNRLPRVPVQTFPLDDSSDLVGPVKFDWGRVTDPDGDAVSYRHCVWSVNKIYNANECSQVTMESAASPALMKGSPCTGWFAVLAALLFFVLLLILLKKKHHSLTVIAILLLVAMVVIYFYCCKHQNGPVSAVATQLKPGEAYYWKVLADDGKGGTVESETYRFELKK
jgi:hypothetical protein